MARKGYLTHTFTLPDGTRKYVYAKNKKELEEKVLKAKIELSYGVDLKDDTLLSDLVQLWFSTEVVPSVLSTTADKMKGLLNKHLMPLIAGYTVKKVTPLQVKMWLNTTSQQNRNTAQLCFRALRQAFNLAEENGLILRSPVLARYQAGGKQTKEKKALSVEEEKQLLSALRGTEMHLFVWFLLATGARRGEALALKWDCVDFENASAHLRRNIHYHKDGTIEVTETMKTHSSNRHVPMPHDLCEALRDLKATTTSLYVFPGPDGGPRSHSSFESFWKKIYKHFGPDAKRFRKYRVYQTNTHVTPHILRHTYATRCFEAGLDIKEVQYLLGHAKPDITLKIYTHYCLESRKETTFEKVRTARSGVDEGTTPVPQVDVKPPLQMLKDVVHS